MAVSDLTVTGDTPRPRPASTALGDPPPAAVAGRRLLMDLVAVAVLVLAANVAVAVWVVVKLHH